MADAVGSRNIWDCLGQLQSSGGDSSISGDARSSTDLTEEEARRKYENFPDTTCAQQLQFDAPASNKNVSRSRKSKKRESFPFLANMQKKLKISHLNLPQKPAGLAYGKVGLTEEHESPLDLSKKSDNASTKVPECPLDLSLKRESENMLFHYTYVKPVCTTLTEESLCITNLANQSGGSITISKQFQSLPCSQKKVSPVRPHIGGKPVVTDSNGNIPLNTFSEAGVKRNVFSNISLPTAQRKSEFVDCLHGSESNMQQCSLLTTGLSETCVGKSGSLIGELKGSQKLRNPVFDIEATQNLGISRPVVPVIDYRSNDLMCSSYAAASPSCSSANVNTLVPDLVRSALGLDSCSYSDSCPNLPSEPQLNVPTYKFQKKSKPISKKTLKAVQSIGDAQKRKSVPLAEVRPRRLLKSTPDKTTEGLMTSEALIISESLAMSEPVLSSTKNDEFLKSISPVSICNMNSYVAGQTSSDLSQSPPTLSLFSPMSKSCMSSSESLLLSPQMPILSPRGIPISASSGMSSMVPQVDTSHPIYSFASCSMDSGSATKTKTSLQFSGSLTYGHSEWVPPEMPSLVSMEASMETVSLASGELMFDSTVSHSEKHRDINKSSNVLPQPIGLNKGVLDRLGCGGVESDQISESSAGHFAVKNRGISDFSSTAINAFVLNSDFGREVYKKSKLSFHAALAFEFDACESESIRPCKDVITKTKYYKLIAPKVGFAVSTSKDSVESLLQNKSPSKLSRESSQKGGRSMRLKTPEQPATLVKDLGLGGTRQEPVSKIFSRRSRTGQSDAKQCCLPDEQHSNALDTSTFKQDSLCVEKLPSNAKYRMCDFKEEPLENCMIQLKSSTLGLDSKRADVCRNAVTSSHSNCVDLVSSSGSDLTGSRQDSFNGKCLDSYSKEENRSASKRKASPLVSVVPNKKEKSTDCDSALIPRLCVHG